MSLWIKLVNKLILSKFNAELKDKNIETERNEKYNTAQNENYNEGTENNKISQNTEVPQKGKLSYKLEENERSLRQIFDKCFDFIVREINIGGNSSCKIRVMYIANMIPKVVLEENIVNVLTANIPQAHGCTEDIQYIQSLLGIGNGSTFGDIAKIRDAITEGSAVVMVDGLNMALATPLQEPPGRTIGEPEAEKSIRGPREGFIETLAINTVLVRKKIKSPNLKMELVKVGVQTKTDIVICYMSNLADKEIVEEVKRRVNRIDIDSVLDSNYIAEYIQDNGINIVPTIYRTEKPDVVVGKVLEGRVAILVDGSPIALTVPAVFPELMISSEDYYQSPVVASVVRWMRYLALFISLTLPALYVSLITFHSELLPSKLMITVVRSRAVVPFNAFVEATLMVLTFSILQEADVRIPRSMGQAVSVVGALVLGQAAVAAGIVSPPMVIVSAFAGISGLAVPKPEMQLALLHMRLIILISAGFLGLLGATCAILVIIIYLTSQRSFGVPFMMPISPLNFKDLGDVFVRIPLWMMNKRPSFINWGGGKRRKGRENPDRT